MEQNTSHPDVSTVHYLWVRLVKNHVCMALKRLHSPLSVSASLAILVPVVRQSALLMVGV